MTVGELGARMSGRELAEWAAYERLEGPVGSIRADIHAALVCQVFANVNRRKGTRAFRVEDFMPKWDAADVGASPEEQRAAFAAAVGQPTAALKPKTLLGPDGEPIEK